MADTKKPGENAPATARRRGAAKPPVVEERGGAFQRQSGMERASSLRLPGASRPPASQSAAQPVPAARQPQVAQAEAPQASAPQGTATSSVPIADGAATEVRAPSAPAAPAPARQQGSSAAPAPVAAEPTAPAQAVQAGAAAGRAHDGQQEGQGQRQQDAPSQSAGVDISAATPTVKSTATPSGPETPEPVPAAVTTTPEPEKALPQTAVGGTTIVDGHQDPEDEDLEDDDEDEDEVDEDRGSLVAKTEPFRAPEQDDTAINAFVAAIADYAVPVRPGTKITTTVNLPPLLGDWADDYRDNEGLSSVEVLFAGIEEVGPALPVLIVQSRVDAGTQRPGADIFGPRTGRTRRRPGASRAERGASKYALWLTEGELARLDQIIEAVNAALLPKDAVLSAREKRQIMTDRSEVARVVLEALRKAVAARSDAKRAERKAAKAARDAKKAAAGASSQDSTQQQAAIAG